MSDVEKGLYGSGFEAGAAAAHAAGVTEANKRWEAAVREPLNIYEGELAERRAQGPMTEEEYQPYYLVRGILVGILSSMGIAWREPCDVCQIGCEPKEGNCLFVPRVGQCDMCGHTGPTHTAEAMWICDDRAACQKRWKP
jgi:hypothetical protein